MLRFNGERYNTISLNFAKKKKKYAHEAKIRNNNTFKKSFTIVVTNFYFGVLTVSFLHYQI